MVMLGQKFNYADENVKCVVKSSLATRCLGYWLCSDTEVNSEFTGMMSWEDSIRWHLRACQRFHHCLDIKEVGVSSWRACDRRINHNELDVVLAQMNMMSQNHCLKS